MKFNYLARTQKGETKTGAIEADSEKTAIDTLQGKDLVVVAIEEEKKGASLFASIGIFDRVNKKDVVVFCRQLAILVGSDVPLVQSLKSLGHQAEKASLRKIVNQISDDVEGGTLLSKAFAKHPKVFSTFYVNLIKSGESAGRLHASLEFLADHLEKDFYLKEKIKRAMTYPIFILGLFVVVVIGMLWFVVPGLVSFLENADAELPLMTRILIGLSDFFVIYGWIVVLVAMVVVILILLWAKTSLGKIFFDKLKLRLPIFGRVFKKSYLAHFAKNLSTLVKGGLPIIQALDISGRVIDNTVFQRVIFKAKDEVAKGSSISDAFAGEEAIIPPVVSQMIKTGEKTGRLDFILDNLASFYTKEVENVVDNLTQLIEPILIVTLGVMVALLMAAILQPMYSITQTI